MALRSGRIAAPFSALSLQRVLGRGVEPEVAGWLNTVAESGCSAEAMGLWVEALAQGSEKRDAQEHAVQMVSTAPAGDVSMHRDTAVVVQDLFRRARRSLLISTYGIYGGRDIFRGLAARMEIEPGIRVRLFLNIDGHVAPADFAADFLRYHWPEMATEAGRLPDIYYDVRSRALRHESERAVMHAKCVVMDGEEVLVTSANFTEAAQQRNIEVGLLVRSQSVARQVTEFFDGLVSSGCCSALRF